MQRYFKTVYITANIILLRVMKFIPTRVSMLEISRLSQELRISSVHTDQSRLEVIRASTVVTLLG